MSPNSQDPADIHYRSTSTLLTDYQKTSNQYFVKERDLAPLVELETGDILTAYEVYFPAGLFGAFTFEAGIASTFLKKVYEGHVQIHECLLQHLGVRRFQPGSFSASLHAWQLVGQGVVSRVAFPALVNPPVIDVTFAPELHGEQPFLRLFGIQAEPEAFLENGFSSC